MLLFLFQAEDGIRDWSVTGVQTCALPFSSRRRHTRLVSDWSSDVCSSDLLVGGDLCRNPFQDLEHLGVIVEDVARVVHPVQRDDERRAAQPCRHVRTCLPGRKEIGRASCRERVEISVVAVSLKKKKESVM